MVQVHLWLQMTDEVFCECLGSNAHKWALHYAKHCIWENVLKGAQSPAWKTTWIITRSELKHLSNYRNKNQPRCREYWRKKAAMAPYIKLLWRMTVKAFGILHHRRWKSCIIPHHVWTSRTFTVWTQENHLLSHNMLWRSIVHKYCEGKVKRTRSREWKDLKQNTDKQSELLYKVTVYLLHNGSATKWNKHA